MNIFFVSFWVFSFFWGIFLRSFAGKNFQKYLQNTLKRIKKTFFWLGIASVLFLLLFVEGAFKNTLFFFAFAHFFIFAGFFGYSVWYFIQEKTRIDGAERRRKEKDQKKKI